MRSLALAFVGGTLLTGLLAPAAAAGTPSTATKTPIKHFVAVMQEKHSFDNYFGTFPHADGLPPATCMPAVPGTDPACIPPFP